MYNNNFNVEKTDSYTESDLNVDPILNTNNSLAFGLFTKLCDYLAHFNYVQHQYKVMATTWMLATFIGIGYMLSGFEIGIPINILLAISILSLFSASGILFLWILDTGIYHRWIGAIFKEIIVLEDKYPFLGNSHHNMINLLHKAGDPVSYHGLFYASFVIFLLTISAISCCIYFYPINHIISITIGSLFLVSTIIFAITQHQETLKSGTKQIMKEKK